MRSPTPFGLGRNGCWLSRGSSYPGHSPHRNHFLSCCPLNEHRKSARSLFKIGRLSSLFSYFSLSCLRLLILLLFLLMSGNVHSNPGPVFPCSVCAGNVTWRGRSVQCCTCSKWVYLKGSLLSFSRFRTLGSFYSRSCPTCCVPASSGNPTPTNTDSLLELLQLDYLHCSICSHPRLQISYPPSTHFISSPYAPSPPTDAPGCFSTYCFLFPPDFISVLRWNAGGLRVRSTAPLHFISFHPVDLSCIQESNLNSSSFFQILWFSTLRFDRTHPRSDILLMPHTLAAA